MHRMGNYRILILLAARLLNTLAHEASHAASWAISGDFSQPHGATFKNWSRKVMAAFPNVDITVSLMSKHGQNLTKYYRRDMATRLNSNSRGSA